MVQATWGLRLLPTCAGVLEKKFVRTKVKKKTTNYVSEESSINVVYDKNTNLASFSFTKGQELVKRETIEGSIEFIDYQMPPHKQNGCTVLFTRH